MNVTRVGRSAGLMVASVALLVAGCGGPEVLPPSGNHPVVLSEGVKIYQTAPSKYELLGTIQVPVTPDMKWDEQGDSTKGFDALKTKAGVMGGNGILLVVDKGLYDVEIGAGYHDKFYLVPLKKEPRTVFAAAIFVVKE